jgi:hypothetical protein
MIFKIDFLCNLLAVLISIGFFIIIGYFFYYKFITKETKISKILKRNKFLKITIIIFFTSVLSIIILNSYSDNLMRKEIISELNQIDNKKTEIFVNYKKVESSSLISTLKEMNEITNKIGGNIEIQILLKSKMKSINLVLRRNPEYENKYWVFVPKYKHSTNNCVGEIQTELLKDYK